MSLVNKGAKNIFDIYDDILMMILVFKDIPELRPRGLHELWGNRISLKAALVHSCWPQQLEPDPASYHLFQYGNLCLMILNIYFQGKISVRIWSQTIIFLIFFPEWWINPVLIIETQQ